MKQGYLFHKTSCARLLSKRENEMSPEQMHHHNRHHDNSIIKELVPMVTRVVPRLVCGGQIKEGGRMFTREIFRLVLHLVIPKNKK